MFTRCEAFLGSKQNEQHLGTPGNFLSSQYFKLCFPMNYRTSKAAIHFSHPNFSVPSICLGLVPRDFILDKFKCVNYFLPSRSFNSYTLLVILRTVKIFQFFSHALRILTSVRHYLHVLKDHFKLY